MNLVVTRNKTVLFAHCGFNDGCLGKPVAE